MADNPDQVFECLVQETVADTVWVTMRDITDRDAEIEIAEIRLNCLPVSVSDKLVDGLVFYWYIWVDGRSQFSLEFTT